MSAITSRTFQHGPALQVPRGARAAAEAFAAFLRLARHVLMARPEPQAVRDRAEEAEAVRRLARRWERSDPGFAADLYAAAARHEGLPG